MDTPSQPLHVGPFLLCCAALVLAATCFSGGGAERSDRERLERAAVPFGVAQRAANVDLGALHRAARRFLEAFLGYEVGELDRRRREALRASATPEFAAQLFARPPRIPSPAPPPAALTRFSVELLSTRPARAVVSGIALRKGARERFSFRFEARAGVWLACGPGG